MLAVMRSLEEWRHFLEGAKHQVEIWTDHKNLEYFMTAKKLNRRQARWSLYLSRFDFVMHHRPGKSMGKCDALSRRADHANGADDNRDTTLLRPEFFAIRALEGVTIEGAERSILREVRKGVRDGKSEDAVVSAMKELGRAKGKTLRSSEWTEEDGLWRFRDRIYVPLIPDLRRRIAEQHHDSKIGGHAGRWKTLELISRNYWWPNLSRFVGQYCKACDLCLRTKAQKCQPFGELHPLPIPKNREVFTLPLVFRTDPRGMARIPRNSAESADPRTPFFWCIVASPFRTDPHGSARNDAESGPFSHGSAEFTRTVPC
jgi:hypothetical protein